jgi:flagellar biogenesis protein FliO
MSGVRSQELEEQDMLLQTYHFRVTIFVIAALTASVCRAGESPGNSATSSAESNRDSLNYTPPAWPDAPDTAAMLRRLVMGTATVLGLCVCTLLVGRRWLRGAARGANSGDKLRLIETVALGNRCAVHLIQAGDQQVLVGIDGAGLKSLVPLTVSFENTLAEVGGKNSGVQNRESELRSRQSEFGSQKVEVGTDSEF